MLNKLIAKLIGTTDRVADPTPQPGTVYSFATLPYTVFSSPPTGRYAAFKVLGASDDHYVVAVLAGVWSSPPTLQQATKCELLEEHRLAHSGQLAVFGVNREWWQADTLTSLVPLGISRCNGEEKKVAENVLSGAPGSRFSTLNAVNYAAEGEWRWTHDREAFTAEVGQRNAKEAQRRAAAERRYRERLSTLTWEQLLSETPFRRWTGVSPYPPAEFTHAARAKIHEACEALIALGPKPRKAWVRKVLKETVEWFNEADKAAEGVIETEEREDICAALEEMAFVAKQKALAEEIDNWREW